jgi:dethiobiotin synthetase
MKSKPAPLVWITATDTNAGKTLLTALWSLHLQQLDPSIIPSLCKPFASGSLDDAQRLADTLENPPKLSQITPFYFKKPLAPAAISVPKPSRSRVVRYLMNLRTTSPGPLLVEGIGGVLVPLDKRFTWIDLMVSIPAPVIVVAPNRLGTLNHCLLTIEALHAKNLHKTAIVLMGMEKKDESCASNARILRDLTSSIVLEVPYLGRNLHNLALLKKGVKKIKKPLDVLTQFGNFISSSLTTEEKRVSQRIKQ